jgi:hypothetical protein
MHRSQGASMLRYSHFFVLFKFAYILMYKQQGHTRIFYRFATCLFHTGVGQYILKSSESYFNSEPSLEHTSCVSYPTGYKPRRKSGVLIITST